MVMSVTMLFSNYLVFDFQYSKEQTVSKMFFRSSRWKQLQSYPFYKEEKCYARKLILVSSKSLLIKWKSDSNYIPIN